MSEIRLTCDVHTHTLFSRHAYSSIAENVSAAADRSLELLGSTDHFSCMLFNEQTLRNFQFFQNMKVWPRIWHGVRLLHGCEADIVDSDGHFFGHDVSIAEEITGTRYRVPSTLKDRVFEGCDYVIASVHRRDFTLDATPAQNSQMYINALQDPKVLILGHIGRSHVKFELDPVLEAARDLGKLIEINNSSLTGRNREGSFGPCERIAERCAELGCSVSYGSDAHICCDIGRQNHTREVLEGVDFPEELVACRSAGAFLATMERAGLAVPEFPEAQGGTSPSSSVSHNRLEK